MTRTPWLVVVDAQHIFASPDSAWGSPMWPDAVRNIRRLAPAFGDRVVLTRWVAPAEPQGSWAAYMEAWPFADRPADDPVFALVPEVVGLGRHVVTEPTFGKWTAQLASLLGPCPEVVLTGVSTDCCVLSTALPAADAGATLTVVTDACAGSTEANQAAALAVLGLYPPQITLRTTDEVLAALP